MFVNRLDQRRHSRWQIQNNGETFFLRKIEMNSRVTYELRFCGFIFEAIYGYNISRQPSTIPKSNDILHLITETLFSLPQICLPHRSVLTLVGGNIGPTTTMWKLLENHIFVVYSCERRKNARNSITFGEMKFVAEPTTMFRHGQGGQNEAPKANTF